MQTGTNLLTSLYYGLHRLHSVQRFNQVVTPAKKNQVLARWGVQTSAHATIIIFSLVLSQSQYVGPTLSGWVGWLPPTTQCDTS